MSKFDGARALRGLLKQMASGKFIQAGRIAGGTSIGAGASGGAGVTFNPPFDNVPLVIGERANNFFITGRATEATKTGVTFSSRNTASSAQVPGELHYIAVDTTFLKQLFGGGALLNKLPVPSLDWGWY